jgi:hypothetical protein
VIEGVACSGVFPGALGDDPGFESGAGGGSVPRDASIRTRIRTLGPDHVGTGPAIFRRLHFATISGTENKSVNDWWAVMVSGTDDSRPRVPEIAFP